MDYPVEDSPVDSPAVKNVVAQHSVRLKLLRLDQAVHHQRTSQSQSINVSAEVRIKFSLK